jgi:hypothetical protein
LADHIFIHVFKLHAVATAACPATAAAAPSERDRDDESNEAWKENNFDEKGKAPQCKHHELETSKTELRGGFEK